MPTDSAWSPGSTLVNSLETFEASHLDRDIAQVLDRLIGFADDAAVLALSLRAGGLKVTHKGSDLGQALTEADEAISRMMHQRFGPRLIEEETAARLSHAECRAMLAGDDWSYVGDPIDGTRPFSGGLSAWGTMIGACRAGWPVAGVMSLPAWVDQRDLLDKPPHHADPRGVIIAAAQGQAWWAPTRGGKRVASLAPLPPQAALTHHVGWLPLAAKSFTLDYTQGFFPHCESASVSDFAALVTGRLDATTFNAAIWDVAAAVPAIEAAGFRIFGWPDVEAAPKRLIDLFSDDLYAADRMWLIARDADQAARLGHAIRRAR